MSGLKYDKEAEARLRTYTAILDLQERLKNCLKAFRVDDHHLNDIPEDLQTEVHNLDKCLEGLLTYSKKCSAVYKPEKTLVERGYNKVDREVFAFSGQSCNKEGCGQGGCGGGCGTP